MCDLKKKKVNTKTAICKTLTLCVDCHSGDGECGRKAFSDKQTEVKTM